MDVFTNIGEVYESRVLLHFLRVLYYYCFRQYIPYRKAILNTLSDFLLHSKRWLATILQNQGTESAVYTMQYVQINAFLPHCEKLKKLNQTLQDTIVQTVRDLFTFVTKRRPIFSL